jgi:hypothetical protein
MDDRRGWVRQGKRGPEAQKLLEYGFKNFTVEAVMKEPPYPQGEGEKKTRLPKLQKM